MRHLVSYLLFVGIPLAGLLGVLRVGQGVEAPRAVHGAWAVQPMAPSGRACTRYLLAGADSTLAITQSGRQLSGKLGPNGEATLQGTLTGAELALEGVIQPGGALRHAGCTAGDTLRLAARLGRDGSLKRLDARLWSSGCPECGAVGFTAARPRGYQGRRGV
jgi:hypothetical protein